MVVISNLYNKRQQAKAAAVRRHGDPSSSRQTLPKRLSHQPRRNTALARAVRGWDHRTRSEKKVIVSAGASKASKLCLPPSDSRHEVIMAKICHRRRIAVFSTVLTAAWLVGIADSFTSAPPLVREFRFSGRLQATKAADDDTEEERNEKMEKALKAMTNFSNKYISTTQTKYCQDKSIAAVVIKGLAEHKVSLGTPLCPCRFYEDKEAEAKDGYWNCPCTPMRER